MRHIVLALFALLLAPLVQSQTLEFTAATTTGNGSVVPVLTWKTTPAASSCTAAGSWTGTKAASGTQTLAAITSSANFDLSCTWPNNTATLTWTIPPTNTDGTPYTDQKLVRIRYGLGGLPASQVKDVPHPGTTTTITGLVPGQWSFAASAISKTDAEGSSSGSVMQTIGNDVKTERVRISVNPVPMAITDLRVTVGP